MLLKERIAVLVRLGAYFSENNGSWKAAKEEAFLQNPWFLPEYIDNAILHIAQAYLQQNLLEKWVASYSSFWGEQTDKEVGIVMAGNIPLVGFHDFLAVFISGCRQRIKLSSKDKVLWNHIFNLLKEWTRETERLITFTDELKNCNAYIATGSNNSARYFDYYFAKYPHIIRRNRSSVAILTGKELQRDLAKLAYDICLYFGLGCRNVTQLLVPKNYDFHPLKIALEKYHSHLNYSKYKNNYDYQLALMLLNKVAYQPADPVLLVPSENLYAPISVLHYREYQNEEELLKILPKKEETQEIISQEGVLPEETPVVPFGLAQLPKLVDYADGVNTLTFLDNLRNS